MQGKQLGALALVLILVAGVIVAKVTKESGAKAVPTEAPPAPQGLAAAPPQGALPKLLDLGSVGCDACKQMEPVLKKLTKDLKGKVDIEFIDVYKDETAADKYAIDVIPTQILLDASGKELFRHTGVYLEAEILAKMREVGMLKE